MEAHVITFRLCQEHDVYFTEACPGRYLEDAHRRERYSGTPHPTVMADVAYLAATSTPWPMY